MNGYSRLYSKAVQCATQQAQHWNTKAGKHKRK